ncbi:alpha/beta hydrolase [Flavobacterium hiemivividum]|uniref:Alpha/beta hydrolase n=1 Tax=Flavobacterium hiemivividum TaxID=2541734 RepID=A0A4R5CPP3_9FLAO|nr:alpha/beta hydrolase [Flavobacterium hiemivividum]TDE01280.1 alpha/beta hydrolase [Flavobacterium hiemivividum]
MNYKILLFLFSLATSATFAQVNYCIDTSYTVMNTFKKEIKKFPEIKIREQKHISAVRVLNDITYTDTKTRPLQLDVFMPNTNKKNYPTIIMIHGGGWKSGNKSHLFPMAEKLAEKGFICVTVAYRLSPEAKYPNGIYDIKKAIQFIKENHQKIQVDTTKLAILGCSSGGQMAVLVGTTNLNPKFQDLESNYKSSVAVQAIIDIDGILAFHHPESKEGEMAAFWLNGTSIENKKNWIEASALTHVDQNTPPTLFINSQYDRFHAGRDDMVAVLKQNAIPYQIEIIENSPHTFWLFDPYFDLTISYITQFLQKTFK